MITRRKKSDLKRMFVLIFIGIICIFFLINYFWENNKKTVQVIDSTIVTSAPPKIINNLEKAVQNALEGSKGTYGVAIKKLDNSESYYLNEHQIFEAGSLYKLWVMVEAFNQIESRSLKEDDILSDSIPNLNKKFSISEEDAELKTGGISLSVTDALKQMITISHNYAALLLTSKIRLSTVDIFLEENGFSESKVGVNGESPITTASDTALFFEKLYKGELANQDHTNQMMELLKKQQLNDKLPKQIPQGVIIAHKTGEIGYFSHDGGIVFSAKGDYIIVVLSETDIPAAAEDRISQISKEVYDYFQK